MKQISVALIDRFNQQITKEFESAYLYLAMSSHLKSKGLNGMSSWFKCQADEEKKHALKLNHYLLERSITPTLYAVQPAKAEWKNVLELFDETYLHECSVSDKIYDMVAQAMEDNDYASLSFLQYFVDEQVEEESTSLSLLEKVRLIEEERGALMVLDEQMSKRAMGCIKKSAKCDEKEDFLS